MNINEKAIREGRAKFEAMLNERKAMAFITVGNALLNDAELSAEYRNLTGNTLTSLSFGFYENYNLKEFILLENGKPPIRRKLTKGEVVGDFLDYDGNVRSVFKADIDTDGGWGSSTSYQFLSGYKPQQSTSIVITTGTEYSEYLEQELGLNVLTDTRDEARMNGRVMFLNAFKKIK